MISLQTIIDNLTPMERAEAKCLLRNAEKFGVKRPNALGHINSTGRPKGSKNAPKTGAYHGV